MNEADADPNTATQPQGNILPPEWVPLADAPAWIEKAGLGARAEQVRVALILAVRDRLATRGSRGNRGPRHRLFGAEPRHGSEPLLPSGLAISCDDYPRVYVSDWTAAAQDLENTGTVAGWDGVRCPVMVLWPDIERWVRHHRLMRRSKQSNQRLRAETAFPATPLKSPPLKLMPAAQQRLQTLISAVGRADTPPVTAPAIYRSGGQGRPTSMTLIRTELDRRRAAGQVMVTMAAESEALSAWLVQAHPEAPAAGAKAVRNSLRAELAEAVSDAKARKDRPE